MNSITTHSSYQFTIEDKDISGKFITLNKRPTIPVWHLKQTHSTVIHTVPNTTLKQAIATGCSVEGDGIIISFSSLNTEKAPLAVQTADCLPILAIGKKQVALLHAGWRGLANNILLSPLIADLHPHLFFIGPHIRSCCYEVATSFSENFPDSSSFVKRNNQLCFSLEQQAEAQIKAHYPSAHLLRDLSKPCTCCLPHFHSHRRNGTLERNWNLFFW